MALVLALAALGAAPAAAQVEGIHLSHEAPAGCPDRAELLARI